MWKIILVAPPFGGLIQRRQVRCLAAQADPSLCWVHSLQGLIVNILLQQPDFRDEVASLPWLKVLALDVLNIVCHI